MMRLNLNDADGGLTVSISIERTIARKISDVADGRIF
jgi:hypothetical protein